MSSSYEGKRRLDSYTINLWTDRMETFIDEMMIDAVQDDRIDSARNMIINARKILIKRKEDL